MKVEIKKPKSTKLLRRSKSLREESGVVRYKDLVRTQEVVREIGRNLDSFRSLAPEMDMFSIDTPRHCFTVMCRNRVQKKVT